MDFLNYVPANSLLNIIGLIIGIIGLIIGLIGAVLTCVFYRRSHRSKEPCWSIRNNVLVEGYSSKIGKLDIRFKDEQVETLSIARIAFWNQGAETIDRHDIETVNPLRIEADEEIEILDVSVSLTNSPSSQFEIEPTDGRKSARLGFDYLNKDQGAIVQVIHTGIKESDIQIVGDIKGINEVKKKDVFRVSSNRKILPSISRKRVGREYAFLSLLMLPFSLVLLLDGIVSYESTFELIGYFIAAGFSFLCGIFFLLLAIRLLRGGFPSGLEVFENEPLM